MDERSKLNATHETGEEKLTLSEKVQQYFEQNPDVTITAAAQILGCSRNTVKKYRDQMLAQIEPSSPSLAMAAD